MKKVAIILINYNQYALTKECIKSIRNSTYVDYEIIVVDNNSVDDSVEKLRKLTDEIVLIESKENLGFSYGCNIGIKYAEKNGFDYVLLLNNDTEIDSKMIENLINNIGKNVVCVPKMYYYDSGKIWYAGGIINRNKGNAQHIGIGKDDCELYSKDKIVDFATGCCILIPINIIKKVGYLDEKYFMYCEDLDYSLRLVEKKIKIKYIASATLRHKVGSSSGKKSKLNVYYSTRNRLYILNKYKFSVLAKIYTYTTRYIRLFLSLFKKDDNNKYIRKGIEDFKKNIMGKVEII